jgi:hypothetical protein
VQYPGFNTILLNFTGSNSHYNGLQTEIHGRMTRDLQLQAAYTYSQAIDPTTGNLGGGDSFDRIRTSGGGMTSVRRRLIAGTLPL